MLRVVSALVKIRTHDGDALPRLLHAAHEIGLQRRVHAGERRGVRHHPLVVRLDIDIRAYGLVRAHERREGVHLRPSHQKLRAARKRGETYEPAHIAVHGGIPRKAEIEGRGHDARHPVIAGEVGVLIAVPHDGGVLFRAVVARAREEEHLFAARVRLDGFAVDLRPDDRPLVVQLGGIARVQHAVDGEILPEIRHIPVHAAVEHIPLDERLLHELDRRGISEVDHARVEGGGLDVIYPALSVPDEHPPLGAVVVEPAVLHEIGIDIREELHPLLVQRADILVEVGIERLVGFPVPVHLLADGGDFPAAPVLRPHTREFNAVFEHLICLFGHSRESALHRDDHAVHAPIGETDI